MAVDNQARADQITSAIFRKAGATKAAGSVPLFNEVATAIASLLTEFGRKYQSDVATVSGEVKSLAKVVKSMTKRAGRMAYLPPHMYPEHDPFGYHAELVRNVPPPSMNGNRHPSGPSAGDS